MGQVILSLIEYDQLKKKSDEVAQLKECFKLIKGFNGETITLGIPVKKACEIFKKMFAESEYNDGSYELAIIRETYDTDVAGWYVKAVKKEDEDKEEDEEQ